MNTLVRTVPRYYAVNKEVDAPFGKISVVLQNSRVAIFLLLVAAVFISALAVVYNQEENRLLFNQLSSMQEKRDAIYVEWGQLLLEESTWATEARVQAVASKKFNMVMPNQQNIVIVRQ